jgi:hypothetical protein
MENHPSMLRLCCTDLEQVPWCCFNLIFMWPAVELSLVGCKRVSKQKIYWELHVAEYFENKTNFRTGWHQNVICTCGAWVQSIFLLPAAMRPATMANKAWEPRPLHQYLHIFCTLKHSNELCKVILRRLIYSFWVRFLSHRLKKSTVGQNVTSHSVSVPYGSTFARDVRCRFRSLVSMAAAVSIEWESRQSALTLLASIMIVWRSLEQRVYALNDAFLHCDC